ncbi:MAG: hypothetical protein GXY36_06150 [Chloroflexi bacterium]|jgi:hypothetical protein|nr:hypothetical protein [Chloroflexota bacterium]
MISTVTTATVTTVTTVALATTLSAIAMVTLLALLLQKEIVTFSDSDRAQALNRRLNVAIVPLLMVFVMLVLVKVIQVVG